MSESFRPTSSSQTTHATMETGDAGKVSNEIRQAEAARVESVSSQRNTDLLSIRIADIVISLVGIVIALPFMALCAIAIKLDSPGAVLFRQSRLGTRGEPFDILKFRKFPDDWGTAGPGVTVSGDSRMTAVGRILERTKLDELPQLFNILRGDMSLVGPRPELMRFREHYTGRYLEILKYKPGLFGPAQIQMPNEPSMYPQDADPESYYLDVLFPMKSELVLDYYREAGLGSYFMILIKGTWITLLGMVDWARWSRLVLPWVAADLAIITVAWMTAHLMRYGSFTGYEEAASIGSGLLVISVTTSILMLAVGVYRRDVRRFAFNDALRTIVCVTAGWTFGFLVFLGLIYRNASVFVAFVGLLLALVGTIGLRYTRRERHRNSQRRNIVTSVRVVIYGSNEFATGMGTLLNTAFSGVAVNGLLDDDHDSRGRVVSGYRVLGSERDLGTLHQTDPFDQLWVACEMESSKQVRLEKWCKDRSVEIVYPLRAGAFENLVSGV